MKKTKIMLTNESVELLISVQRQINELKSRLKKLEATPKTEWKDNDEYYCLSASGRLDCVVWQNDRYDEGRKEADNHKLRYEKKRTT